jgi:Calcium-binding EGF domain.
LSILFLDVNECEKGTDGCQHLCENTKGGYKCLCKPGFTLNNDGKSCTGK